MGWAMPLLVAGCSLSANLNGRSLGPSSGGAASSNGGAVAQVTMPDLAGKTPEQAVALLRSAGINVVDTHENESDLCGENDDHSMTPQGAICKHTPTAGASVSPQSVRLAYTVEHDRFEGGNSPRPWRRMPALVGMTLEAARATLARAQLPIDGNFEVEVVESAGCAVGTVCETNPPAQVRKMVGMRGRIYVGAPRAAAPPPPSPTPPPAPTAPAPQPSAQPDVYF